MSHIATYKASLKSMNADLLKKVLKLVAEKFGGTVSTKIKDYNGRDVSEWDGQKIIGAIQTKDCPRGIGIIQTKEGIMFVGDSYGHTNAFNELKKEIEGMYKKFAIALALSNLGYDITMQKTVGSTILKGRKS